MESWRQYLNEDDEVIEESWKHTLGLMLGLWAGAVPSAQAEISNSAMAKVVSMMQDESIQQLQDQNLEGADTIRKAAEEIQDKIKDGSGFSQDEYQNLSPRAKSALKSVADGVSADKGDVAAQDTEMGDYSDNLDDEDLRPTSQTITSDIMVAQQALTRLNMGGDGDDLKSAVDTLKQIRDRGNVKALENLSDSELDQLDDKDENGKAGITDLLTKVSADLGQEKP
jgi:hypothetical protein